MHENPYESPPVPAEQARPVYAQSAYARPTLARLLGSVLGGICVGTLILAPLFRGPGDPGGHSIGASVGGMIGLAIPLAIRLLNRLRATKPGDLDNHA